MSSVLSRMQNYDLTLTPSEDKVAEYIQKHPEEIMGLSIQEVARRAGVSIASASRLAVALGYRDWKELRHNLMKDFNANPATFFSDVDKSDTGETIIRKIFDCSMLSLSETFAQIDKPDILRVVSAMLSARRVVFFGTGRSGCFAKEEALRFAHLGMIAEAYYEEYQMVLQASRMDEGQIAFGFSNSGRSRATVEVLGEARKGGALTVGIANYRNTPLEKVSDVYFCTSFPRVGEISSSLTARIALLCIMDSIYFLSSNDDGLARRAEEMNGTIDQRMRLPSRSRGSGKGKKDP